MSSKVEKINDNSKPKTLSVSRRQMKRVSKQQRDAMVEQFEEIADGNELLLAQLVEGYDKNHLVVGERFDNWKSIKDFNPTLKTLVKAVDKAISDLNKEIGKSGLQLEKRGKEATFGTPQVAHKVEIMS